MTPTADCATLRTEMEAELLENILPFWIRHAPDEANGGFYGGLTDDLRIRNEVPRSAVLCARVLWTFSRAYLQRGGTQYLAMAQRAYDYLLAVFWDQEFGGLFWQVDRLGDPVSERKHPYAQAFGIYGLAEYHRATHDPRSLALAYELFRLLETYCFDPVHGGYGEGKDRRWGPAADTRLSDKDLEAAKSMNTMLHILEAYSNLLRAGKNDLLATRHRALLDAFHSRVFDPESGHLRLFFDDRWEPLSGLRSFGHDIEGSWLLIEAAGLQNDPGLQAQAGAVAIRLAESVLREGVDSDGGLFDEAEPNGLLVSSKSWWAQAEAVVGFYNAFQLSGREAFLVAARRTWSFIRERLVDRRHGDWHKRLNPDGSLDRTALKLGPWECPYHQARACFEILDRVAG